MQDPSERAPPPRVGPHPPSLRRCAGFGCSTGSAAVLGGGGRNTECFGPRSLLRAGPRRSCTRWLARGRPTRWPCSAPPPPRSPPPRRPATYPPGRRQAWGGRSGGGGGGRLGTRCSSAAGSSLKNKLAFFRSFDRVRNCHRLVGR